MSTTARKQRKREGTPFIRVAKTGTPLVERSWFNAVFPNPARNAPPSRVVLVRSASKRNRALAARGLDHNGNPVVGK